ncbi:glycosyltransferase [Lutibacter sp. HS1-25]|uniref:glycosyltransferase n=1 Tax=Lutibacter sp. HS1-25 TaxID=2485000 RepID=UPI0010126A64|nr:glycosyltransferase [Lutibacter sp. HS1-25]RXP61848.1 glycosyltransferase [Lutibacter sp. HS1-25]
MKEFNFVFWNGIAFPKGYAMTKRRKYIVDHLNNKNITSAFIQTRSEIDIFDNPKSGTYGLAKYVNHSYLFYESFFGKIKFVIELFRYLNLFFDKNKLNILIFTTVNLEDLPFYYYAKLKGYKIVFEIVENNMAKGTRISMYGKASTRLSRKFYKSAFGIFVISTKLKELINEIAPNTPVCILPNSAPITAKSEKTNFSNPIRILYAGTFAAKDGVEFFVKGYIQFLKNASVNTELILTGKGYKGDMDTIFKLIENCPNIKYQGFLSDEELEEIILKSDILTMTRCNSQFANFGFPFKLSEYLASGNTVLATKVGDVESYLDHKKNAYLIEPENIDDVEEALNFLVSNEKEAIEIGRNGLKVVEEYFDVTKNGSLFVNFMKKCATNKKE